ncbi:MAG TPA: hypothetical protein PK308_05395 [Phycisphaerales bacterium]|nr:hypothetical protein [Phycisphaerales bacterium]
MTVCPIQAATTWAGCSAHNSVARELRRFWNNFGQLGTPARARIFRSVVRRLVSDPRYRVTTYSLPSSARSNVSSSSGRNSGNSGTCRYSRPSYPSVLHDQTVKRLASHWISPQRSVSTSLGHRRPPYRESAKINRHSISGHAAKTRSAVAVSTKCIRAGLLCDPVRTSSNGFSASIFHFTARLKTCRAVLTRLAIVAPASCWLSFSQVRQRSASNAVTRESSVFSPMNSSRLRRVCS